MKELPTITYKGKKYTYDAKLSELRLMTKEGLKFINLNPQENELISYAFDNKDEELLIINMEELKYKL
jgi:hypothetical protein